MSDKTCKSSRLLPYPRAKVFQAYSDPALLTQWFGPNGFTSTFHEFDFRDGGRWRFTFHGPAGAKYENEWIFRKIVNGERIEFDHLSAPRFHKIVTLTDEAGQTRLSWEMTFDTPEILASLLPVIAPANEQNFDRLEAVLAKM